MKHVLYIGPYRQDDEWGNTSRALLQMLADDKDVRLVARPVWFNNQNNYSKLSSVEQYENRYIEETDIIIQHGLPEYLNYDGRFKENIAYTSIDCWIGNTSWKQHLDLFDTVLVGSEQESRMLQMSNITNPVIRSLGNPPLFMTNDYREMELPKQDTIFYTIGSLDVKSGLRDVLLSYLTSFTIHHNTLLLVVSRESETIESEIQQIKKSLGIFNDTSLYPRVIIVSTDTSDQSIINSIHTHGDYYIDTSYNCRIGQQMLRAIAHDSVPIVLDTCQWWFPCDYNWLVSSVESPCVYPTRPVPELYSSERFWHTPQHSSLCLRLHLAHAKPQHERSSILNPIRDQIVKQPRQTLKEVLDVCN